MFLLKRIWFIAKMCGWKRPLYFLYNIWMVIHRGCAPVETWSMDIPMAEYIYQCLLMYDKEARKIIADEFFEEIEIDKIIKAFKQIHDDPDWYNDDHYKWEMANMETGEEALINITSNNPVFKPMPFKTQKRKEFEEGLKLFAEHFERLGW